MLSFHCFHTFLGIVVCRPYIFFTSHTQQGVKQLVLVSNYYIYTYVGYIYSIYLKKDSNTWNNHIYGSIVSATESLSIEEKNGATMAQQFQ